jgi:hypothetical protein
MILLLIAIVGITAAIAYRAGSGSTAAPEKFRSVYFPVESRETFIAPESESVRLFRAKQTAQRTVRFEDKGDPE